MTSSVRGMQGVNVSGLALLLVLVVAFVHYLSTTHLPLLPWPSAQDCNEECLFIFFTGRRNLASPDLVPTLRARYLHPPPIQPDTTIFDVERPAWKQLLDWDKFQYTLSELWQGQGPGLFVEVGAGDGEFMSQTLMLERNHSWSGLLIEPDPRAFRVLQQRRRNASLSCLCVRAAPASAEQLWMRDLIEDLPQELQGLVMARSKLLTETVKGDLQQGSTIYVPCAPLSRILLSANLTTVDMLSIATGNGADHLKIRDVTYAHNTFHVKTLLVQYPRSYLSKHPYPEVTGYIVDMDRSRLLLRLYWRRDDCVLVAGGAGDDSVCRRAKPYDLVEACAKYLCLGFATVWTYNDQ